MDPRTLHDLPTPALIISADLLAQNLTTMGTARPGAKLRPHVKAHKCTELARAQMVAGHRAFTCATPREMIGMAAAGLGEDLLLANEVLDRRRLTDMVKAGELHGARMTVAVDSPETIAAAAASGVREVLVDVDIGLPRCGCAPTDAARIADLARASGMKVRGVMGYEGHLMVMDDRGLQQRKVAEAIDVLMAAHESVGGEVISAGGTGTFHLHDRVTEVQAGSYALMDTYYAKMELPFVQACWVLGTVISATTRRAVADAGLKAMGMDHGNPTLSTLDGRDAAVWFLSDEHVTFAQSAGATKVGERVLLTPAHIDPTMSMHEVAWLVRNQEVIDRWPINLRGWD